MRGGRVTQGVVRIEDTVRRPPTPNSDFVQRLLQHLASSGFEGAPAWLGRDERGRDMLSFIPGEVPDELSFHSDGVLSCAASLIRRYHDHSSALAATAPGTTFDVEVVCHNDLSPCNFVFRQGLPEAMIDFDAAAPGSRVHDLGYAAWLWLDIGSPDLTGAEQARRLRVFLEAYGTRDQDKVVAAMLERQRALAVQGYSIRDPALTLWATSCRTWMLQNSLDLRAG